MPEMTPLDIPFELEKAIRLCRAGDSLGGKEYAALRTALEDERKITAGELRPVVHAHWNHRFENTHNAYCSKCGNLSSDYYEHCPSCGALIDGKEMQG